MKHKIIYGGDNKLSQEDRHLFSRGDYECKALMQTKDGKPVVISQHKTDATRCKVEYGFSCLGFTSLDDALHYCIGKFQSISGDRS